MEAQILPFYMRLIGYGVLVINPDGSITYGTWDYKEEIFTLDTTGVAWSSVPERDLAQTDATLHVYQAGILLGEIPEIKLDFAYGITFYSLTDAVKLISSQLDALGYSVYSL
jgi:hypothetical protein